MRRLTAAFLMSAAFVVPAHAAPAPIKRTPIATHRLDPAKPVAGVQVTRLDFEPGTVTGRHTHPVPVIGYVLEGEFIVQVEGQPEQRYAAGQSVYEPADTVIARFDNASRTTPAVLIATYLTGAGQTELIKVLTPK